MERLQNNPKRKINDRHDFRAPATSGEMQGAAQGSLRGIHGPVEGFRHRRQGATVEDSREVWMSCKVCWCKKSLHDRMNASVSAASEASDLFRVLTGVKQGCVLAPVVFNLFVSAVSHVAYADSVR